MLCLKENGLSDSQMCIVTGPRIDLAIALIDRMKKLFASSKGIAAVFEACKEDGRERIQALSLAKECYSMKLDLLTNATVVDDAIESMNSGNEDDKESSEPDYDEDKDQLEEEQEEQTGEITTTNQVF
jgi:TATA-binding protein-associated factor Taf7